MMRNYTDTGTSNPTVCVMLMFAISMLQQKLVGRVTMIIMLYCSLFFCMNWVKLKICPFASTESWTSSNINVHTQLLFSKLLLPSLQTFFFSLIIFYRSAAVWVVVVDTAQFLINPCHCNVHKSQLLDPAPTRHRVGVGVESSLNQTSPFKV